MSKVFRRRVAIRDVIKCIRSQGVNYGYCVSERAENTGKTVVVEYSSPNIAKPFHAGHLRSTILGNFLSNLYEGLGWRVVRLNYLGDWGTQFGLLSVGYKKYGVEEKLQADPLQHLFEVYVKINSDVEAERKSGSDRTQACGMDEFRRMEQGDQGSINTWQRFRDISIKEYTKVYQRLGVEFSEYHSESMYHASSQALVRRLKEDGVILTDGDGKGYIEIPTEHTKQNRVSVLKSDGTTLYITRDIAAILDRYDKYKFDRIHYVVENGQHLHFTHLTGVLSLFPDWSPRINKNLHVKFGRVDGMSTRRGNVVFLKDILDEAKHRMMESLHSKQTTKVTEDLERIADELGRSAIIAQDLSQRRLKSYKFSWDRVLNFKQDSGIFLQYCHARLCSIERNAGLTMDGEFNVDHVTCNTEAETLLTHLTRCEEVVQEAYESLEPYHIVRYLYQLCHSINAAYRTCHVKNTDPEVGKAYLHMFNASRITLSNGMKLIGLTPLEKM